MQLDGFCRQIGQYGDIIEGQYKNGKRHGFQRVIYENGSYELAWFRNNFQHGWSKRVPNFEDKGHFCPKGHAMREQAGAMRGSRYHQCDKCRKRVAEHCGDNPNELFTRCDMCDYNECMNCIPKGIQPMICFYENSYKYISVDKCTYGKNEIFAMPVSE
jgi:hypothetical protein